MSQEKTCTTLGRRILLLRRCASPSHTHHTHAKDDSLLVLLLLHLRLLFLAFLVCGCCCCCCFARTYTTLHHPFIVVFALLFACIFATARNSHVFMRLKLLWFQFCQSSLITHFPVVAAAVAFSSLHFNFQLLLLLSSSSSSLYICFICDRSVFVTF